MLTPLSTGRAAILLGVTEPVLNNLIRRAKITPPPEVVAGRRLWQTTHVLQAAEVLGVRDNQLHARLSGLEVGHVQ